MSEDQEQQETSYQLAPRVNLGQSQFQDTHFVVNSVETPYRKLRQLELEINSIQGALKQAQFSIRKNQIKIKRLKPEDELEAIEIEELEWGMQQQNQMIHDALVRLKNFQEMRDALIESVPKEYWEAGFEAAEEEHWVQHFAKKMALEAMAYGGKASLQTVEQVMKLPNSSIKKVYALIDKTAQQLALECKPE